MILHRLALDKFIKVFQDNYIDFDAFQGLTESDMTNLELPIGARSKIRQEISRMKATEVAGRCKFMNLKKYN